MFVIGVISVVIKKKAQIIDVISRMVPSLFFLSFLYMTNPNKETIPKSMK
jgi:hypothetical protein